jgi:hypothetical protein
VAADFSAVYVRLMQGSLVAQLSKDILGEASPASGQSAGAGSSVPVRPGTSDQPVGQRPAGTDLAANPRNAETGLPRQAAATVSPSMPGVVPNRGSSEVVPDQLEPQMREAAEERLTAGGSDMVQRLRLAPAASLTLAGLARPLSPSGEMAAAQQAAAPADAPPGSPGAPGPGQPLQRQPAGGFSDPVTIDTAAAPETDEPSVRPASENGKDGVGWNAVRRASPDAGMVATPAGAAANAGPQGQAADAERVAPAQAEFSAEGMRASPGDAAAGTAGSPRLRDGEAWAMRTVADASGVARGSVLLSPSDAAVSLSAGMLAAGMVREGGEGVPVPGTSLPAGLQSSSGASLVGGEAFLAAIAAIGSRADLAVSRDMLSAVILNAAMIPGWPFPRAFENPAHAAEARRASGLLAAAGGEEFKLTPEEMIAYLTSIGANARLLKALQDLFARVEKKEAVQLMAWLMALTSALREIEKSVEDLLRKGTRLPEWADALAETVRKSLSRRQRYQI